MNLKFTNISNDNATILLYKHIGNDEHLGYGIDGSLIASEINWLNENYPTLKNIDVKINSIGGSVPEGLSICSAILDSTIPVTTWNSGMAYSIAGVILMCGSKRKMADYGTFMMHEANGNKNEDILNLITDSLAKIFEKTTYLTLEKCKELMSKETWMSAEECMTMGLIDEITTTNNKKPAITNTLELHTFYNKYINKKQMLKLTNLLKLSNDASEDSIVEKVEAITAEKETAVSEMDELKNVNAELKAKIKVFEDAELAKEVEAKTAVIENAVKEGKITVEAKDIWNVSPIKSVELKNLFDSLKTTPAFVDVLDAAKIIDKADDRSTWDYTAWETKDSKGLMEIANSNPVEYKRLVDTIKLGIASKR